MPNPCKLSLTFSRFEVSVPADGDWIFAMLADGFYDIESLRFHAEEWMLESAQGALHDIEGEDDGVDWVWAARPSDALPIITTAEFLKGLAAVVEADPEHGYIREDGGIVVYDDQGEEHYMGRPPHV